MEIAMFPTSETKDKYLHNCCDWKIPDMRCCLCRNRCIERKELNAYMCACDIS